jgi:hypothetical protein
MASLLLQLKQARILTQENKARLIAPNHVSLVSDQVIESIWWRIPEHLLTQANFQRLLTAAEHAEPMAEIERIRDQILAVQAGAGHAADFNPEQSTHTASVHRFVSASAKKLMQSYGPGLNLETSIQTIKAYVNGLRGSHKHQAVKRCIERITRLLIHQRSQPCNY